MNPALDGWNGVVLPAAVPDAPQQAPASPYSVVFLDPHEAPGAVLPPDRQYQLLRLAHQGLCALKLEQFGSRSAGVELEWCLVDTQGRPAPCNEAVLEGAKALQAMPGFASPGTVSLELARDQIESSFDSVPARGGFLSALEGQQRRHYDILSSVAHSNGAELLLCGSIPSKFVGQSGADFISERARYFDLIASMRDFAVENPRSWACHAVGRGEPVRIGISDNGVQITAREGRAAYGSQGLLSFRLEAVNTSQQFHWGVIDQADYVRDHRIAELITPLMIAVAANSPFFLGQRSFLKEARVAVIIAAMHPERVLMAHDWIERPLQQFEQALQYPPILEPGRAGKAVDKPLSAVQALIEHSKSSWPLNRSTLSCSDNEQSAALRIEHRAVSSGPTLLDNLGNAAFFYGLMAAMPGYLARHGVEMGSSSPAAAVNRSIRFASVAANLGNALAHGLDAQITWLHERKAFALDLIRDELLPVADEGLRLLEVCAADRARYLSVIHRRVAMEVQGKCGWTPADVLIRLEGESNGHTPEARMQHVSRRLVEALAKDRAEGGTDILEWYARNNAS